MFWRCSDILWTIKNAEIDCELWTQRKGPMRLTKNPKCAEILFVGRAEGAITSAGGTREVWSNVSE